MDPLKALLIEQKAQYEETYFASSKEWIDASEVEHKKLIESAKSVYTQLMSSVAPLSTHQVTNAVRNTQGESQGDPQRETRARSSQHDTQQTEQTTEARTGQESEGPLTRAQQEALGTPQRSGLGTGQEAQTPQTIGSMTRLRAARERRV
ncbi:unnamed protein product [Arabidopsis halleri]